MTRCPCGRKIDITSCNPYLSATYDNKGNIIRGICMHGVEIEGNDESDAIYCDGEKIYNSVFDLQNSKDALSDTHLEELLEFGQAQISDYLVYKIGE